MLAINVLAVGGDPPHLNTLACEGHILLAGGTVLPTVPGHEVRSVVELPWNVYSRVSHNFPSVGYPKLFLLMEVPECLAIADVLHKAKHYVLGCNNLLLATDHKLLVGIFAKTDVHS